MNITIDNYEAYLVDYLDGNLNEDETRQLQQFVAAQGLDWAELTEGLPHLKAPQIVYENKNNLCRRFDRLNDLKPLSAELVEESKCRHKPTFIPLYVKIASAAAAAGLLLTVSLWLEKSMPKLEPIAELKPILPGRLITADETTALPPRTTHFVQPQVVRKEKATVSETASDNHPETISGRIEMPLVTQLEPKKAQLLPASATIDEPDFDLLAYRMNSNLALAQIEANRFEDFSEEEEYDRELSLIGKGLLWLTNGRHDSFASLIGAGMSKAKEDLTEAATDMAFAAYSNLSEQFDEAKERWEEKREE